MYWLGCITNTMPFFQHAHRCRGEVAGQVRGDAEPVAAHAHVGRPAIVAVAGGAEAIVHARVTSRDRARPAPRPPGRPAHRLLQHREFFAHRPGGGSPITVVRQICANWPLIAGRDLGQDDVADVEHALAGGANGEIVLRRAHQQEIVLGAELLHEAVELGGELEFAHAGARVLRGAARSRARRSRWRAPRPNSSACASGRDRARIRRRPSATHRAPTRCARPAPRRAARARP